MNVKLVWLGAAKGLFLTLLGIGATGSALASQDVPNTVFARQFLGTGADTNLPSMVYDPELQMLVDAVTLKPIYDKNKDIRIAKVTAGCKDCPKYDSP